MKVSIVIPILDSHEAVRRHILHFTKMDLPDDVEFVFVDDGSDQPLNGEMKNLKWLYTNDKRPWTEAIAKNRGVKAARGEYLICTDIDHIITKELIETVRNATHDVIHFDRQAAVLDEEGNFTQDHEILREYGLTDKWFNRNLDLGKHGNSYAMRKEVFLKYGGAREERILRHPNCQEVPLREKIRRAMMRGEVTLAPYRPMIYCFPNGHFSGSRDADPHGLFHGLNR